jgi:bifunctional UDP-N-acetylglucosamine pyrophosphorylase / glucosamine-1-phosphate N-acetyltransferase
MNARSGGKSTWGVVILAAGRGTRMRSATPKLLHDLCGRPLIAWPVAAALEAGADRVVVVVSEEDGVVGDGLGDGVIVVRQARPNGTGGAVLAAAGEIDRDATLIVLAGDVPLIDADLLVGLAAEHEAGGAAATMVTMVTADPSGYGRVVRDGSGAVLRVVETKSESEAGPEVLAIGEINTGVFAFSAGAVLEALDGVAAVGEEIFLPSVLELLVAGGERVATLPASDAALLLGINDRAQLAVVRAEAQRRIQHRHMVAGVTIVEPLSTSIDVGVEIAADVLIEPCTQLRGSTRIGTGAIVGPHATVIDSVLGDGVRVVHSHLVGCELGAGASVGPFAYLRPDTLLRERAKAGAFVEIKNSDVGAGAKVPHLSYIGDTDIGEDTNIGAGSITANYDGVAKHRTTIGARVKGGVDTSYVAPVSVGDDAWTAAGSVVTGDVPAGALAVARARQRNVERYAERRSDGKDA